MGIGFGFGFGFAVGGKGLIGSNVNPLPDGAITTKDGSMIVLTTGSDYILTVDGFVPLNALKTISGDVVKTKELDFITT